MADAVDPGVAAAEARLDRIDDELDARPDDEEFAVEEAGGSVTIGLEGSDGWHVEQDTADVDDEADDVRYPKADLLDAFNESFNARDLDGLMDVLSEDAELAGLGSDVADVSDAIEDLWERRPTCMLTRGALDGQALSVLWELGDEGRWWPIATVHVEELTDGLADVVEFSDDPALLDEVEAEHPDDELDEGARWSEWEEGAAPD